jgi:hypothetical protein
VLPVQLGWTLNNLQWSYVFRFIYAHIYIYSARARTHTHTHPRTIYRLVSVMLYRCTRIFRELWIEYLWTWTLFYPTSDTAIHPEPFAWHQAAQPALPLSSLSPVDPSVLFRCITVLNFIQYIWTNCWKYIPSTHRHPSNSGSSKEPTGSDYLQLPNQIISLYNVDQLHHRKVRDLALWATNYMLVWSWRLR